MKLPNKVHDPEWASTGQIFYYKRKGGAIDLNQRSSTLQIPLWLNELIHKEKEASYLEGRNSMRKEVRDTAVSLLGKLRISL